MNIRSVATVAVLAMIVSALAIMAGCPSGGTITEIGQGQLPGVTTPSIKFLPPAGGGIPQLPTGFRACSDTSVRVDFPGGGSYTNIHVCIYCAIDETNLEVYIQYNCEGNYYKGIRNPTPNQPATPPTTKPLSAVEGFLSLSETSSLSFTVDEEFDITEFMCQGGAGMIVNGESVEWWLANEVLSFEADATVTLTGDYAAIADVLFWGFGQGDVTIVTDDEETIVLRVGFSSDVGLVVVPFIDDEPLEDGVGFLPWRAE